MENDFFGGGYRGLTVVYSYRAPQPSQSLPGAASRSSNRDMRGPPSMDGRRMGGGRMNGGMRRR
jgi:hypothetical protein